ncbi:hypothetical protein [Nocardia sp. CA-290969]|uniref:hypothetical protein n=1 Tax=Nocardia sp. CA-290969 TaxID=3239986 RepID=UPI003D8C0CA6
MNNESEMPRFEEPDGLDPEMLNLDWEEIDPEGLRDTPPPDLSSMSTQALYDFSISNYVHRGRAVFELLDRAPSDDSAARLVSELAKSPLLREDRMHRASMTWAVIARLLAAETPVSRSCAYEVFGSLSPGEQDEVLSWLRASRIEDAHPEN